jgi:four helix bundle protein
MQDYTKLQVWVKAHAVFVDIVRESRRFRSQDLGALRRQLQRSAESIPANIVEGSSTSTNPEFARYLDMSLASTAETHYHLRAARDVGAMSTERFEELSERVIEVRRMLCGLIKRVRAG